MRWNLSLRSGAIVFVAFGTVGCQSGPVVPASPILAPIEWRGREVYEHDDFLVLATSLASANSAAEFATGNLDALHKVQPETKLGQGLLIALDADDPLPEATGEEYLELISDWQSVLHPDDKGPKSSIEDMPEELPNGNEIMGRMMASGIPKAAHRIDLPQILLDRVEWVLIVPTEEALTASLGVMMEHSPEYKNASFAKRMAFKAIMPFAESKLAKLLQDQLSVPVLDGVLYPTIQDSARRMEVVRAIVKQEDTRDRPEIDWRDKVDFAREIEPSESTSNGDSAGQ